MKVFTKEKNAYQKKNAATNRMYICGKEMQ